MGFGKTAAKEKICLPLVTATGGDGHGVYTHF
jgi:hypothetical protein